jgi:hypothetical protein
MKTCKICRANIEGEAFAQRSRPSQISFKVYIHDLCSQACVDYYDLDQEVMDHYQVCLSQDDLHDPPCSTCRSLNVQRSAAKKRIKALA